MAEINSIATASQYTGNANLGGGSLGSFQLDVKPLQNLAMYTFEYNKAMNAQRREDEEKAAKELADLTTYDMNLAPEKDRKEITKKWEELYSYVRDHPDVLDFRNNQTGWLEYNKKRNDFENELNGGKKRTLQYNVNKEIIRTQKNPLLKAEWDRKLEEQVAKTDLRTPLEGIQEFDLAPIPVKPAAVKTWDVTKTGENFLHVRKYKMYDMASVKSQAMQGTMGMIPPEQTAAWAGMSEKERELSKAQFDEQVRAGRVESIESAKNFNEAINALKASHPDLVKDGKLDINKALESGNPLINGVLANVQMFNNKMREVKNYINEGAFKDEFGKPVKFGVGGLNAADYSEINVDDGIDAFELQAMKIIGVSQGLSYETKTTETDLDIKKQRLNLDWWKAKEQNQRAKDRFSLALRKAKSEEEINNAMNNYYTDNFVSQPSIVKGSGKPNNVLTHIQNKNSLPLFTFNSEGKPAILKPFKSTPIYKGYKYEKGPSGKMERVGIGGVIGYEGGYYDTEYLKNGEPVSQQGMADRYDAYKLKDKSWRGSYDDWIKSMIATPGTGYDVRTIGENGATDKDMNGAALRFISNANMSKGEVSPFNTDGVMDDGDYNDGGSESSSMSVGGSTETTY